MTAHTPMLYVRVDDDVQDQAPQALTAMDLSMSDAARLFLRRVVTDQAFPSLCTAWVSQPGGARRAAVPSRRMGNSKAKT